MCVPVRNSGKTLIIDISNIAFIDITAIFTLKDLVSRLKDSGIKIIIVAKKKHQEKLQKLNTSGIFNDVELKSSIE